MAGSDPAGPDRPGSARDTALGALITTLIAAVPAAGHPPTGATRTARQSRTDPATSGGRTRSDTVPTDTQLGAPAPSRQGGGDHQAVHPDAIWRSEPGGSLATPPSPPAIERTAGPSAGPSNSSGCGRRTLRSALARWPGYGCLPSPHPARGPIDIAGVTPCGHRVWTNCRMTRPGGLLNSGPGRQHLGSRQDGSPNMRSLVTVGNRPCHQHASVVPMMAIARRSSGNCTPDIARNTGYLRSVMEIDSGGQIVEKRPPAYSMGISRICVVVDRPARRTDQFNGHNCLQNHFPSPSRYTGLNALLLMRSHVCMQPLTNCRSLAFDARHRTGPQSIEGSSVTGRSGDAARYQSIGRPLEKRVMSPRRNPGHNNTGRTP